MSATSSTGESIILVGTEAGGFFRRAPGQDHWQEVTAGLPADPQVRGLAAHPGHPGLLFAGAQDAPYKSQDNGVHWERLNIPQESVVWCYAFRPGNPDVIFLGTGTSDVYRSENGGDSWEQISTIISPEAPSMAFSMRILDLSVNQSQPDEMYAALEVGGAARSSDGGQTWQTINSGLAPKVDRLDLHGVAATEGRVFISNREGVWRSQDRGDNWENLHLERFSPIHYSRGIRVAPNDPNTLYACAGETFKSDQGGVLRSTDLGDTWQRFDQGSLGNSTTFGVAINRTDPDQVFFCTRDGQVIGTEDGGATWNEFPLPESVSDVISILVVSPD
jgi:photosystem II stability/assembly factor-like uncharacterized protein